MSLKPWREIIVPHPDVLNGTFQQSEFAADLTAVRTGKATPEYGDAQAFYERTFITEGMGRLIAQVSQRLNGKGGEPVIQLQTAFGGGKTHTLLAVYHLASRKCRLRDLAGIPALLDQAGIILPGEVHSRSPRPLRQQFCYTYHIYFVRAVRNDDPLLVGGSMSRNNGRKSRESDLRRTGCPHFFVVQEEIASLYNSS